MPIRLHEEDRALFAAAIEFTSAETGFIPGLIEKDYYCSVLLQDLGSAGADLLFKGGTLLAKVHAGFYRLSEDLDFSISTAPDATKRSRSESVAPIKTAIANLEGRLPGFRMEEPLTGFNGSTQYNALVSYRSILTDRRETIRVEIGVREETLIGTNRQLAHTLLLNPVRGTAFVEGFPVAGLTYQEAMAEKLRAALCRREVAIRDFFDIDHAVRNAGWNPLDWELVDLLRRKLAVAGTGPVDVSRARLEQLRAQVQAQLRPVLRTQEFDSFDLNRAFQIVSQVAKALD
jgi:predicted nucleotidyltransferase component of viral defense system